MKNAFENPWPDGHRELTVLALPDLGRTTASDDGTRLAKVIDGVRKFAAPIPGLAPVPDAGLHLTIQPVNHGLFNMPPLGLDTVTTLSEELRNLSADWSPFSLRMGSPVIGRTGITLDTDPEQPFSHLVDAVRQAIRSVCGPDSIGHDTRPGHMTIVCANRELETDDFASQLRRVRPSHADMMVRSLVLAWVGQNVPETCYEFEIVERFKLAGSVEAGNE
ncbi:2'-5' RNA ligase family protein [Amycolatopsis roodepoortensis]|uniref:2'-5' RNA ligase family protein n=1 Tax=Amycolatopsis roodepoortensis TaxID=700274 RepID=A0ABR9LIN0_9PSEU|nr:2'-5' RNA ligase family protein [Amycolatopsis roodepoortensis]MBE1580551.1 hypothetical protein [Amycolatopsis roodepoortensis]